MIDVINKDAQEVMEKLAKRIRDGGVAWRQTTIRESETSRATDPEKFAVPEWWKELSAARLPTGIYKCLGNTCQPLKPKRNYARDAAAVVDALFAEDDKDDEQKSLHLLEREEDAKEPWERYLHHENDSRKWLDSLSSKFNLNAPGARGHWSRLRDHVLRSPSGSKVGSLDRMLLRDTLRHLHDFRVERELEERSAQDERRCVGYDSGGMLSGNIERIRRSQ